MGYLRVTYEDGSEPTWAREINREADKLDPLSDQYVNTTPTQQWHENKQIEERQK